jgi:hypothetical protein
MTKVRKEELKDAEDEGKLGKRAVSGRRSNRAAAA